MSWANEISRQEQEPKVDWWIRRGKSSRSSGYDRKVNKVFSNDNLDFGKYLWGLIWKHYHYGMINRGLRSINIYGPTTSEFFSKLACFAKIYNFVFIHERTNQQEKYLITGSIVMKHRPRNAKSFSRIWWNLWRPTTEGFRRTRPCVTTRSWCPWPTSRPGSARPWSSPSSKQKFRRPETKQTIKLENSTPTEAVFLEIKIAAF